MSLAHAACLTVALSATRFAIAQDPSEAARHANTKKLLELNAGTKLMNQVLDMQERQLTPEQRNEFRQAREAGIVEALMDEILPIYEKYFSDEEVKALIAFQESPVGSKFRSLQPQMLSEIVAAAQKALITVTQRIQRTAFERQASYYRGVEMAEKGQLEAAISAFRDAIKLDPNNADPQYALGDVLHDSGKDAEALDAYVKATQLAAVRASAHPKLNVALRAADANWHDGCGRTVLMLAATVGDAAATRALLARSADPRARDNFGFTPLSTASFWGYTDVVETLLEGGADVESRGTDGATALMQAATWGHEQVVRALLKAGADVNAKDNHGQTALVLAESRSHAKIVELLKEAAKSADLSKTKT